MRDKLSICLEIPVPWSDQPAVIRAEGLISVLVVAALLLAIAVVVL